MYPLSFPYSIEADLHKIQSSAFRFVHCFRECHYFMMIYDNDNQYHLIEAHIDGGKEK